MRNRFHVQMGEFYGWLSGWALIKFAEHAKDAHDIVSVYRAKDVISAGVAAGWDGTPGSKIIPNRDEEVAQAALRIIDLRKKGKDASP